MARVNRLLVGPSCPTCRSTDMRTAGTTHSGAAAYRCRPCGRYFSDTSDPRWGGQRKAQAQVHRSHGKRAADRATKPTDPADALQTALSRHLRARTELPPVPERIKATRVAEMGFDTPQDAVMVFSDYHFGLRLEKSVSAGLAEYNPDIARARLSKWRDLGLRFAQQDQTLLTIDTLHLFSLGDDLEGSGRMYQSQGLQLAESIGLQVADFVEDMAQVLPEFLSRFRKIRVYKVRGNHGRLADSSKADYPPDNMELFAWQIIAERLTGQLGGRLRRSDTGILCYEGGPIEFYISPGFMMFAEILGWTFALRHGDRMRGVAATYTGAIDTKLRLNAIVGSVLNYLVKGHGHEAQNVENEIKGEVIQNGSFVGPSLLSVEMSRASANLPSQEMFLLHPRYGITSRHRLTLAEIKDVRQLEWIGRPVA